MVKKLKSQLNFLYLISTLYYIIIIIHITYVKKKWVIKLVYEYNSSLLKKNALHNNVYIVDEKQKL